MRSVPPIAAVQHDVFTAKQALEAGWTVSALRNATGHGDLERLRAGVYAVPLRGLDDRHELASAQLRRAAIAIGLTHRRLTISHRAAAALHELPVVRTTTTPCVTFARPFRGRVRGAHLHRAFLWPGDVVRRDASVLFTSPARTVVDLARELGVDDGVVAADAALRRGLTSREQLDLVATRCAGWPGMRSAAHALAHADPLAESALESISRLRMVEARLPAPWPQATIRIGGVFVGRVDFYWDEFGVVGEADGLTKYDGKPLSPRDEKRRQGPMEDAGLIFERWGWDDLGRFDRVAARLQAAFARGRRPDRAPRLWTATPACHSVRVVG